MKKSIAFCVIVTIIGLGILTTTTQAADQKVIKLEFSSYLPLGHPFGVNFEQWCQEVEKRTNGRVKITYHPASTLTSMPQTYDAIVKGIADIAHGPMGITPGRFPLSEVLELPFGVRDSITSTKLAGAFVNKFQPKELQQVKVFDLICSGPSLLHTKKPVRKLEDLAGQRIRATGGAQVRVLKALGAAPIVMGVGDAYDALRKGVLDGIAIVPDALNTWKLSEVVDYTTLNYETAMIASGFTIMNKERWNSLPPDIQKIMDETAHEYHQKAAQVWARMDEEAIKAAKSKNHTLIPLSKEEEQRWYQMVKHLNEEFVKEKSAKGLPAAEALKFCQDWVRENQK
jgi:TRAP-type transport system periplasmic protein